MCAARAGAQPGAEPTGGVFDASVVGCAVGAWAVVALAIGLVAASMGPRIPASCVGALVLVMGAAPIGRWARGRVGGVGPVLAPLVALTAAPVIAWGASMALALPIDPPAGFTSPSIADIGSVTTALVGIFSLPLLVGASALVAAIGRWFLTPLMRGGSRPLAVAAVLACVTSAVPLVASVIRARRHREPDAHAYALELPVLATLPPIAQHGVAPPPGQAQEEWQRFEAAAGALRLTRECHPLHVAEWWSCTFEIAPDPSEPAFRIEPVLWGSPHYQPQIPRPWDAAVSEPMTVRRHADLWLAEAGGRVLAIGDRERSAVLITVREVAPLMSPPSGWIAGAAVGLLLALGELFGRRRLRAWIARFAAAPGLLSEDGRIEIAASRARALVAVALTVTPLAEAARAGLVF